MPSARPSAPEPLGPGRLDRDRGAEHRAEPLGHGRGVRGQAGRVGHDGAVGVGAGEARLGGHARPPRSSRATLSAPSHTGSVSGKCRPRSPRPTAPSTASARAWHTASASLWPPRPRAPSITHAAEDERAVRVLGEAVDVDALADAHAHRRPATASSRSAAPRSSGSVILRLRGSPGTTRTRPPSASTSTASSVALGPGLRVGPAQDVGRGRPGASGRPPAWRGRACRSTQPALVHRLDGVTGGHRRARLRPPPRRSRRRPRRRRGRARPAGAPRRAPRSPRRSSGTAASPQRTESARVAPPATTTSAPCVRGRVGAVARRPAGSTRTTPAEHGPARRHGPFEHRAAGQQGELLQAAEAPAGAAGHHDRPHRRHGATGPGVRSGRRSDALRPSPRPR